MAPRRITDLDWHDAHIELDPSDPDSGGKVCVIFSPPGQPRQRIRFNLGDFPPGSPLRESQPLRFRIVAGRAEFTFSEPVQISQPEWEAAAQRAVEAIRAGGADPITDAYLDSLTQGEE